MTSLRRGMLVATAMVFVGVAATSAVQAAPIGDDLWVWTLKDHPAGTLSHKSPYGLRFDSAKGKPGPLFSVSELDGAEVKLSWDKSFGDGAIATISGTVVRNDDDTDHAGTLWKVEYTLSKLTPTSGGDGFRASAGEGTLMCLNCTDDPDPEWLPTFFELGGKAKEGTDPPEVFTFNNDGHRLPPSQSDMWTGRGWLLDIDKRTGLIDPDPHKMKTNDWLVVAMKDPPTPGDVPEPGALLLYAVALMGLAGVLRRRRATA